MFIPLKDSDLTNHCNIIMTDTSSSWYKKQQTLIRIVRCFYVFKLYNTRNLKEPFSDCELTSVGALIYMANSMH